MYDSRLPSRYQFGAGATTSLTSAAVDTKTLLYQENAEVRRLMFYITTATVSSGSIVMRMLYRPVFGASTNQVVLGTLTIPTAVAADVVYYKDITPYNGLIGPGTIAFEVTTAAAGGGAAGAGVWDVVAVGLDPEAPLNLPKLVASV